MKLAAIAGFAAGTAIVLWTFLRQHSDSDNAISEARERIGRGFAASNDQLRRISDKDFEATVWATFTSAELGEPT
jgi:hypothetical protein